MIGWLITGFLAGSAATGAATWWVLRRQLRLRSRAERRARTAERLAEIGKMTGGLAHEIRNPLSTISMNAQLLAEGLEELPPDSEVRGRLLRRAGILRREVDRLGGILSDFLNYAGELRLVREPADLNALVAELADFFGPQAQQQAVRLRVELARTPLEAPLDAAHLKQAVLNLMLNAVQAMVNQAPAGPGPDQPPRSRELILRTETVTQNREPWIRLHVIDTGPGISPENLACIFDPYFTTKAGGTGLGLPTTRRIIEAHGGTIEVQTDPGLGTDFVISLPVAADAHPGASMPAPPRAQAAASAG